MTRPHGKTADGILCAAADEVYIPSTQSVRDRDMVQFQISYDGRRYYRHGYRYDRLEDAVAYAILTGSRPAREDTVGTYTQGKSFIGPTDAEEAIMVSLGIRFDHGAYRFESFRYDELSDAVNYAKLAPGRQGDDPN